MVTVTPFEDEADAVTIANDTPVRPVRLDLDPGRRPGDPGGARRGDRQPVGELALVGALLDARSAGSSSPASAASSGPDAPDAFTETKNVFIATD